MRGLPPRCAPLGREAVMAAHTRVCLALDRGLLSFCRDLNSLRFRLLRLRDANLEHAVVVARADVVLRDALRQTDGAREAPVTALEPPESVPFSHARESMVIWVLSEDRDDPSRPPDPMDRVHELPMTSRADPAARLRRQRRDRRAVRGERVRFRVKVESRTWAAGVVGREYDAAMGGQEGRHTPNERGVVDSP